MGTLAGRWRAVGEEDCGVLRWGCGAGLVDADGEAAEFEGFAGGLDALIVREG